VQFARPETSLARAQGRLAHALRQERSPEYALQEITANATEIVPGTQCAGIIVIRRGHSLHSAAYTGDLALQVDLAHAETGEGPCLTTGEPDAVHVIEDMSREERWPRFTRSALDLGVASMVSCGVHSEPGRRSVLNVYAPHPGVFDSVNAQLLAAYAAFASYALASTADVGALKQAMVTRQTIGEATGILMERHQLSSREALDALVEMARGQGVALWAVAGELVLNRTAFREPVAVSPAEDFR
jgi:hypothetical protein